MRKLVLLSLLSASLVASAAPSLRRVVTMTTAGELRMEIVLSGKEALPALEARVVSSDDGSPLWSGRLESYGSMKNDTVFVCRIPGLHPELWTPVTPRLYYVTVSDGVDSVRVRTGFRTFEMIDGHFFLNGKKIFLRGNAINPPGRGIPPELESSRAFARDYVRFLKGMNVNIIRFPGNQEWLDVCDEEGMMVFGGRYGRPRGGTERGAPKDLDEAVRIYEEEDLAPFTSHPSTMIYVLSNEMATRGVVGEEYMSFLRQAFETLHGWDDTKLYIGNAGYGMGRSAQVYDVHRYWGWYYNTFLTFLCLRNVSDWQNPGRVQPVTFSECVGNYTGPDGRFNLCSRTKQPGSQLCWTGHLRQEEQGAAALEYQAFVVKNVIEMFRRMRVSNPYLSGLMPFTILFRDWDGIESFAQMRPKPAAYQMQESYQPVLLSWENWQYNAKAGQCVDLRVHVINDDEQGRDLEPSVIRWRVENVDRQCIASGTVVVPAVPYYSSWSAGLSISLPSHLMTGRYVIDGVILSSDGTVLSRNDTEVFVASDEWVSGGGEAVGEIQLLDRNGNTALALDRLGVRYKRVGDLGRLRTGAPLVLAEDLGKDFWTGQGKALRRFVGKGGRVVCLRQDGASVDFGWLSDQVRPLRISNNDPTYLSPEYEYADGMNINVERPEHPVFDGIGRENLRLWSDYTGFDESRPGYPMIYPVRGGFSMREVDRRECLVLADYSRNLSATALADFRLGKGAALLCGFDLVGRIGRDPVAEKLLLNILSYASSLARPDPYVAVGRVIEWGDYESERGIVTGAGNGLVLNTYPIVPYNRTEEYPLKVDKLGYHYVVSYGGWNTRPGVQYVPRGRRPFAPYAFTLGGNDQVVDPDSDGHGYFVALAPPGTDRIVHTFENNCEETIACSVSLNGGAPKKLSIAAHSTACVEDRLPADRRIRVDVEGDRRTVLLRTEFR